MEEPDSIESRACRNLYVDKWLTDHKEYGPVSDTTSPIDVDDDTKHTQTTDNPHTIYVTKVSDTTFPTNVDDHTKHTQITDDQYTTYVTEAT